MLDLTTHIALILLVGLLLYWAGPHLIRLLMNRVFVTHYTKTMHPKDVEKRQRTLGAMFGNIWRIVVVAVSLYLIGQEILGKEAMAPLFASAGIIGVALGFGAQSLIKDFLSGIFIISENQFRVGDVIEIDGSGGTVERIGFRSTVIRDVDGNVHYFPNGLVQHVINKTMDYSMARFTVAVAPDSDLEKVTKIINHTGLDLAKEPSWQNKIIEAPQYVMMEGFTSTAASLIISGKTQPSDQWAVVAEMRQRLLSRFEKEGITIGTQALTQVAGNKKKKS